MLRLTVLRCLGLLTSLFFLHIACSQAPEPYHVSGSCDGFPKTALLSVPGTCVGIVASGLGFPRGVAVSGHDIYVADMGGWAHHKGRLLLLGHSGRDKPLVLLSGLDEPSALGFGPDGKLYIGLLGEVGRVDLADAQPSVTPVLQGLPITGRHPLTAFAFGPNGVIYVNIGSATDHCEGPGDTPPKPSGPCPETLTTPPRASVIKLVLAPGTVASAASAAVVATGLRNSEGLTVLPDGKLVAAVNARDYIGMVDPNLDDEQEPHDTLDILEPGSDYGWPYCYDENRPSPEYPSFDCAGKHPPTFLLPAHAAPLSLLLYQGAGIPALAHTLVVPYHGYRKNGHRLMAMPLTPSGDLTGKLQPIIWGWDFHNGVNPQGSPVGLAEMPDGSVLITEDHNGTLLRLAKS